MQKLLIHKFLRFLGLAAIIATMPVLSCLAQTWKPIGPDENDLPSISGPNDTKLAKGANGSLYIAYLDNSKGHKVTVKKFNGTNWQFVGSPGFSEGFSYYLNLAIAPDGTPYVAYSTDMEGQSSTVFRIKKFNGSAWVDVIDKWYPGVFYSFLIGADGTLYTAYNPYGTGVDPVIVKRFKNNVWEDISKDASKVHTSFNKLVFGPDGTLFLAYADGWLNKKITVKKFVNNTWTTIVAEGITPAAVEEFSIVIAPDGVPYLAYPDAVNDGKLSVLKFNGTNAWVNVGSAGFSTGAVADVDIKIMPDGSPIVVVSEIGSEKKVVVRIFKNNNWEVSGNGAGTTGTYLFASHLLLSNSLLIDADGTPYVSYSDILVMQKAIVKKLSNNKWINVGSDGASPDAASSFAFKYDPNNVPYIVYNDAGDQNKAHVRKFMAGSWQDVGAALSQGNVSPPNLFTDIAFAPNGSPYVVYNELVSGTYATYAKYFNGTNWVPLGTTGLIATGINKARITVAADGTPYVIWSDFNIGASVKKYSGGAWAAVGAQGFFKGSGSTQLIISANGTIYAACQGGRLESNEVVYSGYVFKLTGNTWEGLAATNIPFRGNINFSIATRADNTLYMGYNDGSDGGKFTVKLYTNNNWATVPATGLPANYNAGGELVMGDDGALYMPFNNNGVMKLRDGKWETVGTGRAVTNTTIQQRPVFAISKTGIPTVAYTARQIFVTGSTPDVPIAALKPTIDSFYPATAGEGDTVIIKGSNFHTGASYTWPTSLTVGTSTFASYFVNSDRQITAIVGGGSNGDISLSNVNGTAKLSGFSYVPTPYVVVGGPTTFNTGDSVVLRAVPGTGFKYQWYTTNRELIQGATSSTYVAYRSGTYGLGITLNGVSRYMWFGTIVTVNFTPPAINFSVSVTAATCKGAANGSIYVGGIPGSGYPGATYTATLTGNGVNKQVTSNVAQFSNLAAGTYNICFTIAGKPDYQQCQTVVITEPKDIALYSTKINTNDKTATLNLSGGNNYYIQVNGALQTTTDSVVTLNLNQRFNELIITTDKPCQGVIQKTIELPDKPLPYPNPFNDKLNIAIGNQVTKTANAEVYTSMGKLIYKKTFTNPYQEVQLDLSGIEQTGTYTLKLVTDTEERTFKIIKQ